MPRRTARSSETCSGWTRSIRAAAGSSSRFLPGSSRSPPPREEDNHELYLLCEDIEATAKELDRRKVPITRPFDEERWGRVTRITLPGGGRIGLYQPKHPLAHAKTAAAQSRT